MYQAKLDSGVRIFCYGIYHILLMYRIYLKRSPHLAVGNLVGTNHCRTVFVINTSTLVPIPVGRCTIVVGRCTGFHGKGVYSNAE